MYIPNTISSPINPELADNPEFVAGFKAFFRRHWQFYEDNPDQGFDNFEWCVDTIGARRKSVEADFRQLEMAVEEICGG